jgi:hypothetical protein
LPPQDLPGFEQAKCVIDVVGHRDLSTGGAELLVCSLLCVAQPSAWRFQFKAVSAPVFDGDDVRDAGRNA